MVLNQEERNYVFKEIEEISFRLEALKNFVMTGVINKNLYIKPTNGTTMRDLFDGITNNNLKTRTMNVLASMDRLDRTVWDFMKNTTKYDVLKSRNAGMQIVDFISSLLRDRMELIWR